MTRITVKKLIEILQTFDSDLEVWTEYDGSYFPLDDKNDILTVEALDDYDINSTDYDLDVGKKVVKFH